MIGNRLWFEYAFVLPRCCGRVPVSAVGVRVAAKKYDNPITKDTQQPDKVLFDTAIDDIEHGRFERARLTLQTMMNTYDTSEYLAKAKLAMADSWKREGGAHGWRRPKPSTRTSSCSTRNMEEAAEAQYKICEMQYQQMDKADRDPVHARLARRRMQGRPAEVAQQQVRHRRPPAGAARDSGSAGRGRDEGGPVLREEGRQRLLRFRQPADRPWWTNTRSTARPTKPCGVAADDYNQMGDNFENQQAEMYTRIVRDYPLSIHADDAKAQLQAMGRPVPDADPVAEARMKFELENRTKRSLLSKIWGPFSGGRIPQRRQIGQSHDGGVQAHDSAGRAGYRQAARRPPTKSPSAPVGHVATSSAKRPTRAPPRRPADAPANSAARAGDAGRR